MTHLEEFSNEEDRYIHSLMEMLNQRYGHCTVNRYLDEVHFFTFFRVSIDNGSGYRVTKIPKYSIVTGKQIGRAHV